RPEEIEIFENGVLQKVTNFRFVGDDRLDVGKSQGVPEEDWSSAEALEAPLPPVEFDPFKNVNLVALVFERLPDTARNMARQAALHFIRSGMEENTLVAVFAIDNRLHSLKHFTNNRESIRAAVLRATSGSYGLFESQSTDTIQGKLKETTDRMDKDPLESAVMGGRGNAPDMAVTQEIELEELTVNILRQAEKLMLYQRGHTTVSALRALIREEGRQSGRKTLVLFSTGIQIPFPVVERYRLMLSEANRANVSIYAVDARGLTPEEMMADTRYMLGQAINASRSQMLTGLGRFVTRDETMIDEYAETAIRMNGTGTLDDIARSTGGFLVANTNDPRELIEQVSEDIRTYYEVAYTPSLNEYDGRFRAISVRVSRPGVKVQGRSGYFALPPSTESPIQPYEVPMLVALNSGGLPQDFPHSSRILRFAETESVEKEVFVVEVPLKKFEFLEDEEVQQYNTRFSILVLLKDDSGRIIQKFTQDYPLQGPLEKMGMVRDGSVVFMREADLTEGTYLVESAVVDQISQRVSARRTRLIVPPSRKGLGMSSLAIVRRVDPLPEEEGIPSPLHYQDGQIVPNLTGEILKDDSSGVGIYCVIYPSLESSEEPELILDVLLNGQVVGRGTPRLPAPDTNGVIKFVGTVPVADLKPGRYEVRAYVSQGRSAVKEHAFFALAPSGLNGPASAQ
ncbi:MAG: VWA domain-containing protein, partial [Acidobacteriota bacterium]